MDLNVLTIIASLGMLMWWLVKPIKESLGALQEEVASVRKDVKQNSERIARIEGVIWTDIDKVKGKK